MNKSIYLLLCLLAFLRCSDILEEDISDNIVQLVAPSDGATILDNNVVFWWEELDGAASYEIQVVSPSFDSIVSFTSREISEEGVTNVELTLSSGHYQWKVIGENFGYETDSSLVRDLTVTNDTSMSLTNEILVLTSPLLDEATNGQSIQFTWQALPNANTYNFQIASPDFSNNAFILANELVENTAITKTLAEGEYRWRVRGQNDLSVSPFTERTLTIDITPPAQPALVAPANDATVNLPVLLEWTADLDSERDTLYVYQDSLLNNIILKLAMTNTVYNFNDSSTDTYFWRVRTVDRAGNVSIYSQSRKFLVQ